MSGPLYPPAETPGASPTLGEIVGEITQDLTTLVRQELELAKAEATLSAKKAGKGAGMLAGAGYAGHMVLLFLSIALWWALGNLTGHGWSALIVAIIWGVIGAVLYSTGRKELKTVPGMDRTTDSLKKVPNALKGDEQENR